eukprot:scpid55171/ scgid9084/ 
MTNTPVKKAPSAYTSTTLCRVALVWVAISLSNSQFLLSSMSMLGGNGLCFDFRHVDAVEGYNVPCNAADEYMETQNNAYGAERWLWRRGGVGEELPPVFIQPQCRALLQHAAEHSDVHQRVAVQKVEIVRRQSLRHVHCHHHGARKAPEELRPVVLVRRQAALAVGREETAQEGQEVDRVRQQITGDQHVRPEGRCVQTKSHVALRYEYAEVQDKSHT